MSYTIPLNGWPKGVDNIHADFEMPPDALRSAVNVDAYDSGKLRRRKGRTSVVAVTGGHSMWSDANILDSYYVAGTTLYSLSKTLVSSVVATGLMNGRDVAYHQLNGEVFWSNGVNSGRIVGGVSVPWGVETPAGNATLVQTTGGLPAGTYQVVTTFKNAAGEESGSQNAQSITLTATGGIAMSNLPRAVSAEVTHQCVYATPQNGDVLYKIAQLPIAQTTFSYVSSGSPTVALKTQGLMPMPAGDIIASANGMIFVAVGNFVIHSEPFRYGLYNPTKNFFMFPEDVTIMMATQDGVYVCADKTYFISAIGTAEVSQKVLLPYGGKRGTGVYLPQNTGCAWFSDRGQILANAGEAKAITEGTHVPGVITSGASFTREQQGLRQIITVTQQSETNPLEYT